MALWAKLRGTAESLFQIGLQGPIWKSNSGVIEARDADDAAFVNVRVAGAVAANDALPGGDFFLDNEPSGTNNTYSNTVTNGRVTQERWVRTAGGNNLKTIDYSYNLLGQVTTEVRKVYGPDGSTIIAQMTLIYTYSGSAVTGQIVTRDV